MSNRLIPGEGLRPGEQLDSENGKYRLIFQNDGKSAFSNCYYCAQQVRI